MSFNQAGMAAVVQTSQHDHSNPSQGGLLDPRTALSPFTLPHFGDGTDGYVTISANTNLSRDMNYAGLSINAGYTLSTKGFIIRVAGTLYIASGAYIDCTGTNGGNGSGASGGSAGQPPYLYTVGLNFGASSPGGAGGNGGGSGSSTAAGGAHGTAGFDRTYLPYFVLGSTGGGGGGGYGSAPTAGGGSASVFAAAALGGDGGAGAGTGSANLGGGDGGGGGGVIINFAYVLNNLGTIQASGGAGGNGQTASLATSGNGGGGGGGVVAIFYRSLTAIGTVVVTGGSPGSGGNGGGSSGSGWSFNKQI